MGRLCCFRGRGRGEGGDICLFAFRGQIIVEISQRSEIAQETYFSFLKIIGVGKLSLLPQQMQLYVAQIRIAIVFLFMNTQF